jgi:Fur family transcriptional regulator, ferric uptake regulator
VISSGLSVAERLTAAGQRLTAQRVIVADALLRSKRTVTAQELYERLRRRHPLLGRATVFRTLDLLVDAGLAQRFERAGHACAYVACEPTHHHHLVCRACGASTDIDDEEVTVLVEAVRARHGFVLDHDALDFHGVCGRCEPGGPRS